MTNTWEEVKLGDVSKMQYGYTASASKEKIGPKFLRITDIVPDIIDWDDVPFCEINDNDYEKYKLYNGDILIARTGATAGYAKLIRNFEDAVFASYLIRVRPKENCYSGFVGRLIESNIFKQFIDKVKGGAAQPQANAPLLKEFSFLLPPLPTQHKIAGILSAYDDLIANNTRRIAILEEMAQRIYKEWFVDFKYPGHENDKMVGSELGKIPEGWEVKKIKEVYDTASGGTPSRKIDENYGGNINWLKTGELNDNYIIDTEEKITELGLENSSVKIFPENTVIMAMYGATIGKLGITSTEIGTNQACCAFLPKHDTYGFAFIFSHLLQNRSKIIGYSMGAAQQNLSQLLIKEFSFLIPPVSLVQNFNYLMVQVFNEMQMLLKKNTNLRQTRDLLLPKLISGKVDVSELDIDVGAEA